MRRNSKDEIKTFPFTLSNSNLNGKQKWKKTCACLEGVRDFFYRCRKKSIPVYIVSHKTEFANYDTTGTSLHAAAMDWLYENSFFEPEGMGLNRKLIFFESTRQKKIERIKTLGCRLFIDDLEETFQESNSCDNIAFRLRRDSVCWLVLCYRLVRRRAR